MRSAPGSRWQRCRSRCSPRPSAITVPGAGGVRGQGQRPQDDAHARGWVRRTTPDRDVVSDGAGVVRQRDGLTVDAGCRPGRTPRVCRAACALRRTAPRWSPAAMSKTTTLAAEVDVADPQRRRGGGSRAASRSRRAWVGCAANSAAGSRPSRGSATPQHQISALTLAGSALAAWWFRASCAQEAPHRCCTWVSELARNGTPGVQGAPGDPTQAGGC